MPGMLLVQVRSDVTKDEGPEEGQQAESNRRHSPYW
jgi:hypothetical protein